MYPIIDSVHIFHFGEEEKTVSRFPYRGRPTHTPLADFIVFRLHVCQEDITLEMTVDPTTTQDPDKT